MGTVTDITRAQFSIGDLVDHRLFDYRGVIVDVDPNFQSTEEWYEMVAKSRPPKDISNNRQLWSYSLMTSQRR